MRRLKRRQASKPAGHRCTSGAFGGFRVRLVMAKAVLFRMRGMRAPETTPGGGAQADGGLAVPTGRSSKYIVSLLNARLIVKKVWSSSNSSD